MQDWSRCKADGVKIREDYDNQKLKEVQWTSFKYIFYNQYLEKYRLLP